MKLAYSSVKGSKEELRKVAIFLESIGYENTSTKEIQEEIGFNYIIIYPGSVFDGGNEFGYFNHAGERGSVKMTAEEFFSKYNVKYLK